MSTAIEGLHKPSAADLARGNEVQLAVLAGKTPGLREHARDWKMRAVSFVGGLMGLSSILSACAPEVRGVGGPNPIQVNPDTNPALATAAAQAEQREATAVAAATAEAKPAEVTPARQGGGKPEETGTKAPVQEVLTQEQLLTKVDGIIDKIKNPDPELMAKYQVVEDRAVQQINNILYGADPKSITNAQKYLPISLYALREAIVNGEYARARKIILNPDNKGFDVFSEVKHGFLTQDTHNPDDVYLQKAELEILDPEQVFAPTSKLNPNRRILLVSAVNQEPTRETMKLYYALPPQGK